MLSWIWKGTQYWNASSLWYGKHLTNSGSLIKYLWYLILPRLVWAYLLSDLGRNGMLDWYLVRVEHKSLRGKKLYLKSLGKKQDIKYRKASVDFSSLIANKGCCQWPVHFVCSVEVDSESSLSVEGPLFTWRDFGGTACFISIHLNGPSQAPPMAAKCHPGACMALWFWNSSWPPPRLHWCNWFSVFLPSWTLFWPQALSFLWVDEIFETSLTFISLGCMICSRSCLSDQAFSRPHSTGGRERSGADDYIYG